MLIKSQHVFFYFFSFDCFFLSQTAVCACPRPEVAMATNGHTEVLSGRSALRFVTSSTGIKVSLALRMDLPE